MSWRYKGGFIQEFFDPLTVGPSSTFWAWGSNVYGQYGNNDIVYRSSPVQVGGALTWTDIGAGSYFSLGVKSNGTLWSWGVGNEKLGQGTTVDRSSPVQIGSLTNWSSCKAFNNGGAAINTSGQLWVWGNNFQGQLGQNTKTSSINSPVQFGAFASWSKVAQGNVTTAAVATDGKLWTCGYNAAGEMGVGDNISRSSPIQVGSQTDWSDVASGTSCTLALKTTGTIWAWGNNLNGQLGQNNLIYRSSPVQIGALTTWSKISSFSTAFVAIKTDGTLWAWGNNAYGQIGNSTNISRSSPVQVGSQTDWSYLANGGSLTMAALKTNGTLWTWGYNVYGQIGDGTVISRSSPVQIGSATNWYKPSVNSQTLSLQTL